MGNPVDNVNSPVGDEPYTWRDEHGELHTRAIPVYREVQAGYQEIEKTIEREVVQTIDDVIAVEHRSFDMYGREVREWVVYYMPDRIAVLVQLWLENAGIREVPLSAYLRVSVTR